MANEAKNKRKGSNGTGDSLTVYFDCSDPAERKALEAARLLAAKHGRRKQAIIALLEAIYNRYEASGELISASEISSALLVRAPVQSSAGHEISPRFSSPTESGVVLTDGARTSAQEIANNFLRNVGSAFFD
jgi:hypothetical protein